MARKPRIHYPGAFYHAMLRGNARQIIFFTDTERLKFCLLLQEAVEKYKCKIHAFCLMDNHVHLAIQVNEIPLSKFMQSIGSRYASWVNKRTNRMGHLFQGRFKAILIDSDAYLLELVRYIHLNPVRAQSTSNPEKYYWSSHIDYLNYTNTPWITTQQVLARFNNEKSIAIQLYKKFVYEGIATMSPHQFHTGEIDKRIIGDEKFIHQLMEKTSDQLLVVSPKIETIVEYICSYYKISKEELLSLSRSRVYSEPRALIVWLATEFGTSTLTEAATLFRKDIAQFIRKIRQLKAYKAHLLENIKQGFNKSISQA